MKPNINKIESRLLLARAMIRTLPSQIEQTKQLLSKMEQQLINYTNELPTLEKQYQWAQSQSSKDTEVIKLERQLERLLKRRERLLAK